MQTILWATDGSRLAEKSGEIAKQCLEAFPTSRLIALYVEQPTYEGSITLPITDGEKQVISDIQAHIAKELSHFGARVQFISLVGVPADTICHTAEKEQADVILIGSHAHNTLERIFVGSVSTAVLQHAKCPVMVIR
ncbi:MAG: universal stress protein [Acidibacillus sp.]|nr:universal stress protein [Acidibacillus sp.]